MVSGGAGQQSGPRGALASEAPEGRITTACPGYLVLSSSAHGGDVVAEAEADSTTVTARDGGGDAGIPRSRAHYAHASRDVSRAAVALSQGDGVGCHRTWRG